MSHGYAPSTTKPVGYGQPQPIISQPTSTSKNVPGQFGRSSGEPAQTPPNCPPGLEYLTTVDQLFVKQKVEGLEVLTGFETRNRFTVKNKQGEKVYFAIEDSDCCNRNCCGACRDFDMKILDNFENEVIHLELTFQSEPVGCCACCLRELRVYSPPGHLIGTVEEEWSLCTPMYNIKNETGQCVLKIEGPPCSCGTADFQVLSKDKSAVVGKISKQWSGFARELFTDADFFGISFPKDLDVRMKAVMLGASFLILVLYELYLPAKFYGSTSSSFPVTPAGNFRASYPMESTN
ncbi:hypothetical protein V9T40_003529 [Parthenolecanium corni]|uniref:Phospholipid scramblase n=1 Tax=Parthenolecanium corni TaxID=536013 RepID=A0AAN9YAG9_9HEMI